MVCYHNRVLRINLTKQTWHVEPLNMRWAEKYYGGKGLGMKYFYEEVKAGIDPLSPDNKMFLAPGAVTGTCIPCNGKLSITVKSPATNLINECSIGGMAAGKIKYAGYDMIIVEGKSPEPVLIKIDNDQVNLVKAGSYWGMSSFDTEIGLNNEYGHDYVVLSIGQAGEKLVPISCINSELFRQAGRGGVGAVMGSKNVKAMLIKGDAHDVEVADADHLMEVSYRLLKEDCLTDANTWVTSDGTPLSVDITNGTGTMPCYNYQDTSCEHPEKINTDAFKAGRVAKKGCFTCALCCGNVVRHGQAFVEGPEYETITVGGSNCGIFEPEAIVEFNHRCDDYGIDVISAGSTIAWCMEMTEKGIHDFGIHFGEVEKYLDFVRIIALREGIGNDLCMGVKYLAAKYGGKEMAIETKGLEYPGYDPRGAYGQSLAYATCDRGGCHMRGFVIGEEVFVEDGHPYTFEGKPEMTIRLQHYNAVKFSLQICDLWACSLDVIAELMTAAFGREFTVEELETAGERIYNLSRMFNCREGFTRKDDTLPPRLFNDPVRYGATKGRVVPKDEFDVALGRYYQLRDWDANGIPTPQKIAQLDVVSNGNEHVIYKGNESALTFEPRPAGAQEVAAAKA